MDTLSGKTIGQGLDAIPSNEEALNRFESMEYLPFDQNKKEREMIIYRSFNLEKINK
jgi:hypothetical protein